MRHIARSLIILGAVGLLSGCSSLDNADAIWVTDGPEDGRNLLDKDLSEEILPSDSGLLETSFSDWIDTVADFDEMHDADYSRPGCQPGDGCFLDPCNENSDCLSGWCVDHMGDAVCTSTCQEECPPGWSCQQLSGVEPDVVFVCISKVANLCKPCSSNDNCLSAGAAQDACLNYGPEGHFCGSPCTTAEQCPWGFSCATVETIDGISLKQCIADAGICPCTERSIELGLWTSCFISNDYGTCTGKRICTDSGLSECDGSQPAVETCNGIDDDCDEDTDEPTEIGGNLINLCFDGNECTEDLCNGADGCSQIAIDLTECKDGNPCTVADHCEQGICLGSPVDCNDSNPCTDDSCNETGGCVFEANFASCDDGDPCSVGDQCKEGQCSGFQTSCDCLEDKDCLELEDGDVCNGTLFCDAGELPYQCEIVPDSAIECPAPSGPDASCQKASCDPVSGLCSVVADNDGGPCEDGDQCTLGDTCIDGACQAGPEANCNDGNPCTDDLCDPAAGCAHPHNNAPCSDDDVCTVSDHCTGGQCMSGNGQLNCNDDNPCTDDQCDPATGCTQLPNNNACDDSNPCTTGDHCDKKVCVFDNLTSCNDDNPCTDDTCTPDNGCIHLLNSAPCNDQSLCTSNDTCQLGMCQGGDQINCNDNNACTADSCNPLAGCEHLPTTGGCDDSNLCTSGDQCSQGQCIGTGMLDCDDQNFCTTDSCVPAQGCLHLFNDAPCNDADLCTIQDHCNNGSCTGGELLNCNDDNPCTDDACTPDAGCEHTPNDAVCTDSNECTIGDHCAGGECTTTGLLTCDDQNFCTNDNCDPVLGCTYSANTQPCDDNDVCTANDLCADGICKAGPAIDCPDDGNTCTMEYCDPDDGCSAQSVPDCCGNGQVEGAEECDDGNQQDGDGCSADCMSGIGCSDNAEYHYEVVAGIWACVNNQIISTYQENNSMCAAGWTPATNKLVQGLPFPSHQQHQAMGTWHSQVMASNGGYIRTGQKRRGGCTPEAHGDIYINSDGSHYEAGAGWHDLFHGGPSCVPDTHAANNMSHKLAGVICVQGTYELPQ